MKQTHPLRVSLPPSHSHSSKSFFSNPYAAQPPSPPPRTSSRPASPTSTSTSQSSTSSSASMESHSPLLPPPGGHRSAYPFPARPGLLARLKVMGWKGRAGGGLGSPMARRLGAVVLVLVVVGVLVLGHHGSGEVKERIRTMTEKPFRATPPRPPPSYPGDTTSHAAVHDPTISHLHTPWFLPALHPSVSGSTPANPSQPREIDISSLPLPAHATLLERLAAWEASPGGRGPGLHSSLVDGTLVEDIELGGFGGWNMESCAGIKEQVNTHMVQKSANVWGSMNRTTIHQTRMRMIEYLRLHADETVYRVPPSFTGRDAAETSSGGRGIVMVAGNADTLTRVLWSVKMMRLRGSTLPVQVFHFPEERLEDGDGLKEELREVGVELVEAKGERRDKGTNKSYHLKALAIVQSPWKEVLYLDSDSIPTTDPEYMFDAPNYKRLGLWATPDYWKTSGNNAIWAILGIRCRDEWEMETGQMFIDKSRHLDVFILTKFMLEHHEYFFYFSDGDKDIFRWAMLALRKRWAVPGRWVGAAALPSGTASGDFCSHTMLQHDSWGKPLFVHYNLMKQIPSGIGRGFSWGRNKVLPMFDNDHELRKRIVDGEQPFETLKEDHLRGNGDVDCDMLADADNEGNARSPARVEVRRRAARERGAKASYHGGWISALCIDLNYNDPRPEYVRAAERVINDARQAEHDEQEEQYQNARDAELAIWEEKKRVAEENGMPEPAHSKAYLKLEKEHEKAEQAWEKEEELRPKWDESPIEVEQWNDYEMLRNFENDLYDLGFVPSGEGF